MCSVVRLPKWAIANKNEPNWTSQQPLFLLTLVSHFSFRLALAGHSRWKGTFLRKLKVCRGDNELIPEYSEYSLIALNWLTQRVSAVIASAMSFWRGHHWSDLLFFWFLFVRAVTGKDFEVASSRLLSRAELLPSARVIIELKEKVRDFWVFFQSKPYECDSVALKIKKRR